MGIRESTLESVGKIMFDLSFYSGKKVFVTGHTGFKGPGEREIMEAAENKALELLKEMQAEK